MDSQQSQLTPAPTSHHLQATPIGLNPIHSQHALAQPSEQPQSAPVQIPLQPQSIPKTRNGGRKKIKIVHIEDDRSRQVTFLKRKNGILKKAHELSVLCGCDVAVIVFNNDNGKLYEYFNPSAEDIFLRYSNYAGPSERRLSDVMEIEDSDMPHEEPVLATAAASAAGMAAMRHAQPGNYEHPPPNLKRLHPNVAVPPVQVLPPPAPVHPGMTGNSWAGSSSKRLPAHGPAHIQTPVSSRTGITGSSKRPTPKNLSRTIQALSSQMLPPPQSIGKSLDVISRPTAFTTPLVARSLRFHAEQQPITPHTASNQIAACFGLTPSYASSPSNPAGSAESVDRKFGNTTQAQTLDSTAALSHSAPHLEKDLEVNSRNSGAEAHAGSLNHIHYVASAIARPPELNFSVVRNGTPARSSPPSLMSQWTGSRSSPRRSTAGTTAEESWNMPFLKEQMQEGGSFEAQQMLPPLTPFLMKRHHNTPENVTRKASPQKQSGSDALPSPSDAGLMPWSTSDPIQCNPFGSGGAVRRRDSNESLPKDGDSKMRRLE